MADHIHAAHLHPELANVLRNMRELAEHINPEHAQHDPVLMDGLSCIGSMATNLLLGTHSDGRPLVGTPRHADRAAAALVWDAQQVAWRPAHTSELADAVIVPGPGVSGAGQLHPVAPRDRPSTGWVDRSPGYSLLVFGSR